MSDTTSAPSLAEVLQQASALLMRRQAPQAEMLLQGALSRWPDQPDLVKFLGSAREQAGDLAAAETLYRRALALDPKAFTVATQIGHMLRNQGRYGEAVEAFRSALTVNPNHVDALHGLAVTLRFAGHLQEALAFYDRALALAPGNPAIHNNRGLTLSDLGRPEDALTSFSRAVGLEPNFFAALINRGIALLGLGRHDEALKNFDRALALDPNNPGAVTNRSVTLQHLKRYEDALAGFDKALAIMPGNAEAWSNRAVTLNQLKRHEEALSSCDRALALNPDHAPTWNNRGMVLQSLSRLDEALASFEKATELNPDYQDAWNNRGILLTDLGRPKEALACFDRVLAVNPTHAEALRNTGLALFEDQRIAEGLEAFAEMSRRVPGESKKPAAHKSKHDEEQRAYLSAVGGDPSSVDHGITIVAGERLAGPAINPDLDVSLIGEQWRQGKPPIVVIDNFLSEDALIHMRKFCLGSTFWEKIYEGGYLGAMPERGFASPLLAQIAEEMRVGFPDIFKSHPLRYLWSFKYDSSRTGIAMHADQAAVNVNFWITPNEANLDQDSGGLVVWDVCAPLDWDFDKFNNDVVAMREFLARTGAKPVVIPHRTNRAVIFDSDLFHETDKIMFKEGYENRRINITLLYGRRNTP